MLCAKRSFIYVSLKFAADMAHTTGWKLLLQNNEESRKLSN